MPPPNPNGNVLYTHPPVEHVYPDWAAQQVAVAQDQPDRLPNPYPISVHKPDTQEKVRSGPGPIPWFLPYFDPNQTVQETQQMRQAYRTMLNDSTVNSGFQNNVLSVMALDLQIHPGEKKDRRSQEQAEFVKWNLTERSDGGLPGLVWEILHPACIDGYSVTEPQMVLEDEGEWRNKKVLERLKAKDLNNDLVPIVDEYRNVTGFKGIRYNRGEIWPPEDFLFYSHLGLFGNPGGRSIFRAVYGDYWFLDTAKKLRAHAGEKRSLPVIVGEWQRPDQQDALENILAKIRFQNWLAVPPGVKVQVIDIAGSSSDFFRTWEADLRERIIFGLQGAVLQSLTGQEGQQRGNSSIHKGTANTWQWHLQAAIVGLFNHPKRGLIRRLVRPNFANLGKLPRASMGSIDDQEMEVSTRVVKALVDLGLPVSKQKAAERFGWEMADPNDPEDALVSAEQEKAGLGQPGEGLPGEGPPPLGGRLAGLPARPGLLPKAPPRPGPAPAVLPKAPAVAQAEPQKFSLPGAGVASFRSFAEHLAESWNAREAAGATIPDAELDAADRRLQGSGVHLDASDGGPWRVH